MILKDKRAINVISVLALLMCASVVNAMLPIQQYQGIEYATGGIGQEERQSLNAISSRFNLKIVTSLNNGDFVNAVQVEVRDATGQVVFAATTEGPWLLAKLQPGTYYRIIASKFGNAKERQLTLGHGQKRVVFQWAAKNYR